MSDKTATERLRALLDEHGVEWDYGITGPTTTRFRVNGVNGVDLTFTPMRDGLLCSTILTPEQAIAATLGSCNCSNNCTNSERTSDVDATGERQRDAVEVVRCRDCEHYRKRINGCVEFGDESRGEYANVEPDGFCAWGERKDA